jgi:hypothetical protein
MTSIKQDHTAQDTSLGPVSNAAGYAVGVLVVVAIP